MYSVFSSPFSPPTPPDGSLTAANILSVCDGSPMWTSEESSIYLDMPRELHDEIARRYDGENAKKKLILKWLDSHPCPSWEHVVELLRWQEEGRGRVGAAEEAEEKYLKSELCGMHTVPRAH